MSIRQASLWSLAVVTMQVVVMQVNVLAQPPIIQNPPAAQGVIQGAPVVQGSPTVQGSPIIQGAPVVQGAQESNAQKLNEILRKQGGTVVPISPVLNDILKHGGAPKSIEQLKELERQQRKVAKSAIPSTVSVQIGPAQGCGVIITGSGYILTAAHVAMRPNKIAEITLSDGRKVMATTLGMNREVDAGLIKINSGQNGGRRWPHATLGKSQNLVSGMWCIATGHPGGYDGNRGPVTRVGRILAVRPRSIVTDCALIGGDSGGPLFDLAGRLIAVHSRIGNDVADNLHVQIDHYDDSWDRLVRREAWGFLKGFKPVLGVRAEPNSNTARLAVVKNNSPAEDAGMEPGDVIEQFGDAVITNFQSLKRAVADTMPGERVPVWLNRNGRRIRVTVSIGREED